MRKIILPLLVLVGLCNVALATSIWTDTARSVIGNMDRLQRKLKPIWQSDPPAGASEKYKIAWRWVTRKAKEAYFACDEVIRAAEKIERGDESQEAIDALSKELHKVKLAMNEFEEALADARRIQRDNF